MRLTFSRNLWEQQKASDQARRALNSLSTFAPRPRPATASSPTRSVTITLPQLSRRVAGHFSILTLALAVAIGRPSPIATPDASAIQPEPVALTQSLLDFERRPVSLLTFGGDNMALGGIVGGDPASETPDIAEVSAVEAASPVRADEATRTLPTSAVATVKDDETNMRSGPALYYGRVGMLNAGDEVRLLARHQEWFLIQSEGVAGQAWMLGELLDVPTHVAGVLPEASQLPPIPTWIWPAAGAMTSGFGWRPYPAGFHDGLDVANDYWTPIWAARSGMVIEAGWCSGFGYCVKMEHDEGFSTVYGHMVDQPEVRVGDYVEAGKVIGYMGSTFDRAGGGYSTGSHLHFIIQLNGEPVDPAIYLP